jgi:hypothetical protein
MCTFFAFGYGIVGVAFVVLAGVIWRVIPWTSSAFDAAVTQSDRAKSGTGRCLFESVTLGRVHSLCIRLDVSYL